MKTRHVVLVTYGEPQTPGFLAQLHYSRRILLGLTRRVAPIPKALIPLIAFTRARRRRGLWAAQRYASPLEPITRDQATGLTAILARLDPGTTWRVDVAYEFRNPLIPEVLDGIPAGRQADVVPLYVAASAFTHELTEDAVARWANARRKAGTPTAKVRVLPALDERVFAELSARYIREEITRRKLGTMNEWALVLAAHGTLLDPPRPMETGREATERICGMIRSELAPDFGLIVNGWLNHVYGGRWTQPPVEEALERVSQAGHRRVIYYPYGFGADNAESELEGRVALQARPELSAVHLPCLNTFPEYLEALAAQVLGEVSLRSG
jgi:protoheme ferro-lyase